ncbi:MAG: single-stranded DNA-binding protein [Cytophagales bacterium]|nr:single-stranded DNA-binding protein [Cytophagales bacterium]
MRGVNKVILLGFVGSDPEIKELDNGGSVATFSLATNRPYKNKAGEQVTETEWHNIVCWSPLTNIVAKFVSKGSQIHIEGHIKTRSYTNKEGVKIYKTEIKARELVLVGKKEENPSKQEPPASPNNEEDDDDRYAHIQ